MARPLPTWPRGRRRTHPPATELLLGCPRVSPEFELSAVRALMKPQTRGSVEHRDGLQPWPAATRRAVDHLLDRVHTAGVVIDLHHAAAGEYHLVATAPGEQLEEVKAVAVALSRTVPDNWFVLGRWFLRAGVFHRRRYGYRLELVPATNVHLTRPMRALVRQLLAPSP